MLESKDYLARRPVGEVVDDVDRDVRVPVRDDFLLDAFRHLGLLLQRGLRLTGQQVRRLQVHLLLEPESSNVKLNALAALFLHHSEVKKLATVECKKK